MDVILNQTVEITCHIVGTPPPTVTWSFDGKPLLQTDDIQMDGNGTVIIHNVKSEDEGRYTCKAENKAGKAEADTYVQVIAPPRIFMQSGEIKVVAGRSATIRCEVFGSPAPEVVWLKNEQPFESEVLQTSTNLRYFHLREARVEDAGRYTCIAKNRAGEQRASTELHVLVVPVIEDVERVIQVKENNTLTISCTAEGIPPPQITWKKDGTPLSDVSGPRLVVAQAATTDAGRYTCTARNEGGHTSADFAVDVLSRPKFKGLKTDIRVVEGEQARLECKMEGHPPPTVRWLRGGRTIEDMSNFIISPRGETLLILKARRSDAGSYSCVAKNAAAETEVNFMVSVLVPPHIDEQLDQHPHIVQGKTLFFFCPVLGNPDPTVEWLKDGQPIESTSRINVRDGRHLEIIEAQKEDEGRYTCHAYNEAGVLDTDFRSEIVAPPQFILAGESVYEVVENEAVTLDCGVANEAKPEIRLIIRSVSLADGGKYTCKASNEAGSSNIDLVLKVRIPQPTVSWVKDGVPVDMSDSRLVLAQSNQTFGIELVKESDQARYTCIAVNKGGTIEQDFVLEVLRSTSIRISDDGQMLEIVEAQREHSGTWVCSAENDAGAQEMEIRLDVWFPPSVAVTSEAPIKAVGDTVTLLCEATGNPSPMLTWSKAGHPIGTRLDISHLDTSSAGNYTCSARNDAGSAESSIHVDVLDQGTYTCIAMNSAGNDTIFYNVGVVQAPIISYGGAQSVIEGEMARIECTAEGHPAPIISWLRNGIRVESGVQGVRYIAEGKVLTVIEARSSDSGIYVCEATNEAGTARQAYTLEVLVSLKCGVRGYPEPEILWSVNNTVLPAQSELATIDKDGTLSVKSMSDRLVTYKCTAKNEAGTDEIEYEIHTISAPVVNEGVRSINSTVGEPTSLTCDITGDEHQIQWYKNDISLLPSSNVVFNDDKSTVNLVSTKLNDEGKYTCTAENRAGKAKQITNLYVGVPPKIVDGVRRKLVKKGETAVVCTIAFFAVFVKYERSIESGEAFFRCEAVGVPQPAITWMRDDKVITDTTLDDRGNAQRKSFMVDEVSVEDAGVYTCKAENWAGTTTKDFDLVVIIPPTIVPDKLDFTVEPQYQLIGTSLAVRNILPSDAGFYHCIAKSEAGQSIGNRRLIVDSMDNQKSTIWVDCDEENRPVKTTYMQNRGDVPDNDQTLLPWKEKLVEYSII
ncbi:unnamed protein product [Nippostrongylus brasiliensis]|uniref:Immunoglobulin I-set domain protein n=1 Tax=Nippostrongylus brasiliensis TaxID=27835 RepID=A0A158QYD3_NIPBR|nr:unnamed protein product [Nippostrongylus brasiliensis]